MYAITTFYNFATALIRNLSRKSDRLMCAYFSINLTKDDISTDFRLREDEIEFWTSSVNGRIFDYPSTISISTKCQNSVLISNIIFKQDMYCNESQLVA